jgi:P2 family phage contractile tail tube protein
MSAQVTINRITNANVYLNGVGLLGQVEEINLPEIKFMAAEHKALGMIGKVELTSGIDKMEYKIKWNSFYPDVLKTMGNPYKTVSMQVRGSLEGWEAGNRSSEKQITAYLTAQVANFPGAAFKQHDNVEMESQMKCSYYKLEIEDIEIIEIDVMANIHRVDGQDLLANFKANIGG